MLGPFEFPSNHLSRTMYDTMPMPWSLEPPVAAFCNARMHSAKSGIVMGGSKLKLRTFLEGASEQSLENLARSLGTAVREINCAGGLSIRQFKGKLKLGAATALLLFRRGMG